MTATTTTTTTTTPPRPLRTPRGPLGPLGLAASALALAASALLLAAGCSPPPPPPDPGVDARVVHEDAAAVDAPSACLDPAEPAPPDGLCRCNSDCANGTLCEPETLRGSPRGRCLATCTSAAQCGPGYRCFGTTVMQCNRLCTTNADCGPSRYCFGGACRAICQRDEDCESGYCNRWSTHCEAPGTPPGPGALTGAACLRDEDCRSNFCVGGACTSPCSLSAQGCPAGETCIGSGANDLGLCYQLCTAGTACRLAGAACTPVEGRPQLACQ